MHVVKLTPEFDDMPEIVASPTDGVVREEPMRNDWEDIENTFERYYYGGRVQYDKPRPLPPYHMYQSYKDAVKRAKLNRSMLPDDCMRKADMWDFNKDDEFVGNRSKKSDDK